MADTKCKPLPHLSASDIARFWKYVDVRGTDECWPWTAAAISGYGVLRIARRWNIRATRIAIFLKTGVDPFPLQACHSCDVRYAFDDISYRRCCNWNHLFPGTQSANLADMVAKGRSNYGARHYTNINPSLILRGEMRGKQVKLSAQQVTDIRNRYAQGGISQQSIGDEYGVSNQLICRIVNKKIWTHIP